MTRALIAVATVMVLSATMNPVTGAAAAQPVPPYDGTIFLDPDIVTGSDPSVLVSVTDGGRGTRVVYDRRVADWVEINAYLFDVVYADGLTTEAVVNPEFGSGAAAREQADTYAWLVGQLPHALRVDVDELWIHRGTQPFGGGNHSILIHTGQSAIYQADGILEETLIHEATHTSLDEGYYAGTGWGQAQADDDAFISTYARDFPLREDVAETFLLYLAVRYRLDRIDADLADTVRSTIPHRLEFLDAQQLDLYPITPRTVLTAEPTVDGWMRESRRTSGRAGAVRTGTTGLPVGDDRAGREIRSLLSFDIDALPQTAVVTGVQLQVTRTAQLGRAPEFLQIDLWSGSLGSPAVSAADFSARPTRSVRVAYPSGDGPQQLTLPAYADVFGPGARVQVRVRAIPVRDRNGRADQVVLASGESASQGPRLTVAYSNG